MLHHDKLELHSDPLATRADIQARIEALGATLIAEFKNTNPLFVCLLRGGMPFASRLMFAIAQQDPYFHPELDYMTVSRYGKKQVASLPHIAMDLNSNTRTAGRPIIVLDDMIDRGGTYLFTKNHLKKKGAQAVYLAVLVQRELNEPREVDADFHCFSIASQEWLTGMGLDDTRIGIEANRWADFIAIANPSR
jgi:hypoxanthine phosphoribosyltransferase